MKLNSNSVKKYYEEIYKLIQSQSQILNMIMKVYKDKKTPKNLPSTLSSILDSSNQLSDFNSNLLQTGDASSEEFELVQLILDSTDKTLLGVHYSIEYVYRIARKENKTVAWNKDIASLSEEEVFDRLIKNFRESLNILERVINWLENIKNKSQ
ncbi:hypothetical protein KPL47_06980 [Clostridium estertheticum]|uniref:hypothetical protein n=1 Tax=Clostridium estertheticum TaxID=238834 RepID=UPI001C0B8E55|nr:hypothetical protein [Clostridium estertheticum]MBU3176111.1 hypothetical protein [Clostridium estertheticum]